MAYFDFAATTKINDEVLKTYYMLLQKYFYNPSSLYNKGQEVFNLQEKSRANLAKIFRVDSSEIIFTGSGSEANNLAIKGIAFKYLHSNKNIVTSVAEHSSVYDSFKQLEEVFNFDVRYCPLNNEGCIDTSKLEQLIDENTVLVSTMYVNNELGSINDIMEIKKICNKYKQCRLHVDMVQALGKLEIDLTDIDLASFSAHKINGIKGSGLLFKRKNLDLIPLITGGQQEFGLRAGTENTCANIVFAKTLRLALEDFEYKKQQLKENKNRLINLLTNIEGVTINSNNKGIDSIVNISIPGYKPEVVLHYLEDSTIYISTKSACSSKNNKISRVLENTNLPIKVKESAIRISLSSNTTFKEIDLLASKLAMVTTELKGDTN